jgi:hypothetical protein
LPNDRPTNPLMSLHPKGGLPASQSWPLFDMAPPIKQENLPAMEDCRLLLKNAVEIKRNASVSFKLTAIDALVIAGFDPEVAKNQSMVNRFNRLLHKSKVKEVGDGEPPVPPVWPPFVQQLKAPPVPNPMPPPLPPVLGGTGWALVRFPLSPIICKATPQAMETPSPLSAPAFLSSQRTKNIYRTPHQVDVAIARRRAKASTEDEAMSAATRLYALEKQKPNGKSSATVAAEVNLEFGSTISARTLRKYAQDNHIGLGKGTQGRPRFFVPVEAYHLVCEGYYTHVRLVQEAGGSPSPTCFGFDFWRSRWKRLIMEWFFATSGSKPAMTRASMAVSVKFAEAFSLILTAFLSRRRQSSNGGRFSCFIGGAIINAAEFGRQEGLPLDAGSSGGLVGRSLGKTHPKTQTNGSPYLLTRSASSFQQRPFYIYRRDLCN